jgi:fluoride exporter
LSIWFRSLFPTITLGTLVANLVGGYLIGVVVAVFSAAAGLPPEPRLFAVTGFLGGLTTRSTSSAEIISIFTTGQFRWAALGDAAHLIGSLLH